MKKVLNSKFSYQICSGAQSKKGHMFYIPAHFHQVLPVQFFEKFYQKLQLETVMMDHEGSMLDRKDKELYEDYSEFLGGFEGNKYIVGEGIGALYAMRICQLNKDMFKGAIFVNPLFGFETNYDVGPFKKAKLFLSSKDKIYDGLEDIKAPGDMKYSVTNAQFLKILNFQSELYDRTSKFTTPSLFLLGEQDKVTSKETVTQLFNQLKNSTHRKRLSIEFGDHFILHHQNKGELHKENHMLEAQKEAVDFVERLEKNVRINVK